MPAFAKRAQREANARGGSGARSVPLRVFDLVKPSFRVCYFLASAREDAAVPRRAWSRVVKLRAMDASAALTRINSFHEGIGVDAVCQLCLVDVGNEIDEAPKLADSRCSHRTCPACVAELYLDDNSWGIAGCPSCSMDDTDCGLSRLFVPSVGSVSDPDDQKRNAQSPKLSRAASQLLTRESCRGAKCVAVAGVLLAERRAIYRKILASRKSSSDAPETNTYDETQLEFWGPAPDDEHATIESEKKKKKHDWIWWDCGAQLKIIHKALPPIAVLDDVIYNATDDEEKQSNTSHTDIAIVSNGSALLGSGFGVKIDKHSTVVRFNEYETDEYELDVGSKCDVHATGWLISASRDLPSDRLTHEGALCDSTSEPYDSDEEPQSTTTSKIEIRLVPNVEKLGRKYFVSYLRAVVYHWSTFEKDKEYNTLRSYWSVRQQNNLPIPFVVAPTVYGKHWRHVRDTFISEMNNGNTFRKTPRVTSGYAFLLLALDVCGLPVGISGTEQRTSIAENNSPDSSWSNQGSVTLYGFEDDLRNKKDAAGGHFFDKSHTQHHSLYDLPWERRAVEGLADKKIIRNVHNPAIGK